MIDGRSDNTGCGLLAEVQLRTMSGTMHILGSYWPEKPDDKYIKAGAGNLWTRVSQWLTSTGQVGTSPAQYVQTLALQWMHTAH